MDSSINPIFCAIDTGDLEHAKILAQSLKNDVFGVKLGLEFFTRFGMDGVEQVVGFGDDGIALFLDLKLHDIPNTVAGAVRSAAKCGAVLSTVHACGGFDMMKAAVTAAQEKPLKVLKGKDIFSQIIAVTVLTSMDDNDLLGVGIQNDVQSQVLRLAETAYKAGVDGLVCSAHEITAIRERFGNDLKLIVPGVRPENSENNDQKRIMTPKQAMDAGADILVIGRPITRAIDPVVTARDILASLAG